MSDLTSDIARIAALRGKPVANYNLAAQAYAEARRRVDPAEVFGLFRLPDMPSRECAMVDVLPARSRALIKESPLAISSLKYADLLQRVGDETSVVDAVRAYMPQVVAGWIRDHYGRTHPSLRRLS